MNEQKPEAPKKDSDKPKQRDPKAAKQRGKTFAGRGVEKRG